ncbi:uncharacterized protein BO96DRAFT_220684 [Aspergillus niger CBS 101883]|uniref:uncharacterized protein n=1 Tax=Aspergillus lacticoffeatus (strain CBS 101883) TaxID=1450533 RepID=UPI000D80250A|nr:uncharacterized protein BO96DRAFT_220684 [Aspergillus niger CBS 101883]PYH50677.1 hypothetical protein BO96DRAFT_220684 [Aspergillus niger CBS 101883]
MPRLFALSIFSPSNLQLFEVKVQLPGSPLCCYLQCSVWFTVCTQTHRRNQTRNSAFLLVIGYTTVVAVSYVGRVLSDRQGCGGNYRLAALGLGLQNRQCLRHLSQCLPFSCN